MHTTYHLSSAQELNLELLNTIKATFKSKAITIIVKEDDKNEELGEELKAILDERLQEEKNTYLTAEESINQLNKKYGL